MRQLIISCSLIAFTLSLGAQAAPIEKTKRMVPSAKATRAVPQPNRNIANKLPSRVLTFVCRETEGTQENVMGLTQMSIDLRDETTGAFATSLYLRTDKGYMPKTINGTYTTVPGGFVLRTKWTGVLGEYTVIHVHPSEKTQFPGINNKQACEVTAQLVSN